MFLPGTKVIITESGVKKSSGPKAGSLGYFIDGQDGNYFTVESYYVQQCKIAFVRYGFEQKDRFEIKEFISFVPIKKDETKKNKSFKKWANKFLENFGNEAMLDMAMNYSSNSPKSTYYGVLAPLTSVSFNVNTADEKEWSVRMSSILLSKQFNNMLSQLATPNGLKYFRGGFPLEEEWHNILIAMTSDRSARRENLKTFYNDNERRKSFTKVVNCIMAVALRHSIRDQMLEISKLASGGNLRFEASSTQKSDRAVRSIVHLLFTPSFEQSAGAMLATGRKDLNVLTQNMRHYRSFACSRPATVTTTTEV